MKNYQLPEGTMKRISDSGWNTSGAEAKPRIKAEEFNELRRSFRMGRLIQYQERMKISINEARDVSNEIGGHAKIDKVVDAEYRSKNAPDPSKFYFI